MTKAQRKAQANTMRHAARSLQLVSKGGIRTNEGKPGMSAKARAALEKKAGLNAAQIKVQSAAKVEARHDYAAIIEADNTARVRFERIVIGGHNPMFLTAYRDEFHAQADANAGAKIAKGANAKAAGQVCYNQRNFATTVCKFAKLYGDMSKAEQSLYREESERQHGFHGWLALLRNSLAINDGRLPVNATPKAKLSAKAVTRIETGIKHATDKQVAELLATCEAEVERRKSMVKGRKGIERARLIREAAGSSGPRAATAAMKVLANLDGDNLSLKAA